MAKYKFADCFVVTIATNLQEYTYFFHCTENLTIKLVINLLLPTFSCSNKDLWLPYKYTKNRKNEGERKMTVDK